MPVAGPSRRRRAGVAYVRACGIRRRTALMQRHAREGAHAHASRNGEVACTHAPCIACEGAVHVTPRAKGRSPDLTRTTRATGGPRTRKSRVTASTPLQLWGRARAALAEARRVRGFVRWIHEGACAQQLLKQDATGQQTRGRARALQPHPEITIFEEGIF